MNKWMIWGVKTPIFGSTPIFVGQATILPMPSFHRPAAARSSELLPMPLSPAKVMATSKVRFPPKLRFPP